MTARALGRIMKLNKANFAGLTSPGQQSEMKSILAGTWPPLKPLPVFKYETAEYRATIDFDKKRGEWVCRKTSLPSNEVQELRGGLREITLALPHSREEIFAEGVEEQEPEFERETNRRLKAIREWKEKYENGARYFELRESLSERQRAELDDSLRLSLTARQLQFNAKNAANVFDDLSVAGGRFAAILDFAKQKKANPGIDLQAQAKAVAPGAECATDQDSPLLEIGSPEVAEILNDSDANTNDALVANPEAKERSTGADEFPALSIKDVSPEQELTPFAERMVHAASQEYQIHACEFVDKDSASPVEPPHQEEPPCVGVSDMHHSPAFADSVAQRRTDPSFSDHIEGSSLRIPALRISAFQVNVFAILLLFAVTAFTVGLTVGRGPLGKRLRDAPKSLLAADANPPALPDANSPALADQADESAPRTPPQLAAGSDDSAGVKMRIEAASSEEKSKESTRGSEYSAEVRTDSDSSPRVESKPSTNSELNAKHGSAVAPIARKVRPRATSNLVRPRKAAKPISRAPISRAPYKLTSAMEAVAPLSRPSTVLVTVPSRGSQPFRVSFPEKTIGATSSLAMTSQLSVLVFPEPAAAVVQKSARLEAGELVSFGWPLYPRPGERYGLAQTIRVRATVGQLGQVQEVKFLGGSASLLPATSEAIRQWHYRPTLLDQRPVQAEQDITIEFRPPQYSARLSTRHPSHN